MSKLSFRARALDAAKPMPIYMAEELPDLPDYSAINRAVPQMPSGMEKEEECEHHLQRAICAGLIIPTPEVSDIPKKDFYDKVYPADYKQPRQLIHMQPFTMEQDIPDYDMDSDDERWLQSQTQKMELSQLKFEEMMDRLEKSSGQTVVTINEAKALLKEDDDLIIAVFDYWLNKRLKTQHPLILTVKTEHRSGTAANNPYLAFRRRTEKMQTRKNRKNDECSYEKMLKLRRDLVRAVTVLELIKKREKMKREHVHLTIEIFEKRFVAKDFSGAIYAEAAAVKTRPAFTPIFHNNHYTTQSWTNKAILKDSDAMVPRKEKRQYKKRKHKAIGHSRGAVGSGVDSMGGLSDDDEEAAPPHLSPEPHEDAEDDGQFAFKRNKLCSYHKPLPVMGNWPWCPKEEGGLGDRRFRFTLTSLAHPRRCIGFARRRLGRGGRVILDRIGTDNDDLWRGLDFTILERPEQQQKPTVSGFPDDTLNAATMSNSNTNGGNGSLRTDIKSELSSNFDESSNSCGAATQRSNSATQGFMTDFGGLDALGVRIKQEVVDEEVQEEEATTNLPDNSAAASEVSSGTAMENDDDEMIEILRTVRRDWLHFRPKTPPPGYEPPCHMQPLSETYIVPSANPSSFSVELQSLDLPPSTALLLDPTTNSTTTHHSSPASGCFLSDPFAFDAMDYFADVVPITDTRQQQQTAPPSSSSGGGGGGSGAGGPLLNTLNNTSSSSVVCNDSGSSSGGGNGAGGGSSCSNSVSSSSFSVGNNSGGFGQQQRQHRRSSSSRTASGAASRYSSTSSSQFRVSDVSSATGDGGNGGGGWSMAAEGATQQWQQQAQQYQHLYHHQYSSPDPAPSTPTSLKYNSKVNATTTVAGGAGGGGGSGLRSRHLPAASSSSSATVTSQNATSTANTNGLLSQFGFDCKMKNNKLSYAYSGGVGFSNASSGTMSLHQSAHTLTLNSHSANILEIPIVDESKSEPGSSATNNKTKTIVRKNNLIMEVT